MPKGIPTEVTTAAGAADDFGAGTGAQRLSGGWRLHIACRCRLDLMVSDCAELRYGSDTKWRSPMAMKKFIIERDIPKVGTFEREQLRQAASKSNDVLRQLGPDIQWIESYVADNKTFCVYLAKDEAIIRKHAEISGFPATKITEVKKLIDPTTATV